MGVFETISLLLNLVFGGGLIVSLATLRATKNEATAKAQRAVAEAKTNELDNVESAIKIWREIAQDMADKYEAVSRQVEQLSKEVKRLNTINNKIVKLLDKITPENIEHMVSEIKKQINESGN